MLVLAALISKTSVLKHCIILLFKARCLLAEVLRFQMGLGDSKGGK